MNTAISDWRAAVDVVDRRLLCLLNTRAKLVCELAKVKREAGIEVIDAEREQQVLDQVLQLNSGPLDRDAVTRIFRRIIREARRIQLTQER